MRINRLATPIIGSILSFLLSLSAIACLVTGFDMVVDLDTIALWCLSAAIIGSVFCALPLQFVPFLAIGILGAVLWITGELETSFFALLYRLSRQYNGVHGWGILRLTHGTAEELEGKLWLTLCFLGAVIAIVTAWSVCRRKTVIPGILMAASCLGLCLVVTNTVPDTAWLYGLLFGALLIMITHTVRRENATAGNKLTAIAALPLGLVLLVLFLVSPPEEYTGEQTARGIMQSILNNELTQQVFGELTPGGTSGSSVAGSTVRLDAVGVRLDSDAEILQVHTQYSGILYLRGRALDSYDGLSWSDSGKTTPRLYWPKAEGLSSLGEVTVQTRYAHRMLYLPYYVRSMDLTDMTRGLENEKKLTKYSFATGAVPGKDVLSQAAAAGEDYSEYLHLTDTVKQWAKPLAEEITIGKATIYEKAQAIADYVRGSARYSLKTDTMPARERDFARWFLEDSATGYCVHFASSTVVLLQAAGIPARYVTGYMTPVGKDCYTSVREQDAHAWAEYWLPGFGWTILEATPAAEPEQEEEITVPLPKPAPKAVDWNLVKNICLGILLSMIPAAFFQSILRRSLRKKKLRNEDNRQRLLAYWQEAALLARCLGTQPDTRLRELAERTKFSPYLPGEQDFEAFRQYLQSTKKQLRKQNLPRRIYQYFILAV